MLFFELFPAFVMFVVLGVGAWLFVLNRRADGETPGERPDGEEP
jgi:hypothetical protein